MPSKEESTREEASSSNEVKSMYRSMQNIVFDTLRDEVLSGVLKPGDMLNTLTLSKRMGVSRTPLREALNRLASIGLVENEPHRGFFVRKLSVDQILEIYYIRAALSGACTRLAARNISVEDLKKLEKLCEEMETSLSAQNHKRMLKENLEFHSIIFKAAKSPRLEALVVQYFLMSDQYRALALELPGRYDEVCHEHRKILEALKSGDPAGAEQQEKEHQFNTARRLAQSRGVEPTI